MCRLLPALLIACLPASVHAQQLDSIAPAMQKFVDDGDLAGAVTVVGNKAGVLHHEAVGFRDLESKDAMKKDTLFRIASMTKPITAIAVMILVDEGKLSPDDDVAKHLPEFAEARLAGGKKPARPIKIRDLLTHTSGLGNYPKELGDVYGKRDRTLAECAKAIAGVPLNFEPGTQWAYCNSGMDTLGRLVEVASGESFESFLQKRVFDPLEMKDTTFYPTAEQRKRLAMTYNKKDGKLVPEMTLIGLPEQMKHPIPAGGLVSCAADLAKLYRMMLSGGELNGKRILSAKSVAEMTRTQNGLEAGFVPGMSFGYGWAVVKEPKGATAMLSPGTYGHGGAFGTQAWVDPKQNRFVILLIQRTGLQNADASPMRQKLQELAVPAKAKPASLTPQEIADGWILLFDRETTYGWTIDGESAVKDGALLLGGSKKTTAALTTQFFAGDFKMESDGAAEIAFQVGGGKSSFGVGDIATNLDLTLRITPGSSRTGKSSTVGPDKVAVASAVVETDSPASLSIVVPPGKPFAIKSLKFKPHGTKALFNGKNLDGWKVTETDPKRAATKFEVTKDGELSAKNGPGDLHTEKQFDDFVLQLECKTLGKALNSGVFFRCIPDQYQNGYEAQIQNTWLLDRTKPIDFGTGAIYRRIPARKVVPDDNEWFTLTLAAQGPHFSTWVNGYQTVDWTDERKANDNPRQGLRLAKGHLSIQGHDPTTDLLFRNIRIVELPKP
jgi:CubicO group peptidase (beta-lactamase class C family)